MKMSSPTPRDPMPMSPKWFYDTLDAFCLVPQDPDHMNCARHISADTLEESARIVDSDLGYGSATANRLRALAEEVRNG